MSDGVMSDGSREISLVPSLHRASTDALIPYSGFFPFG